MQIINLTQLTQGLDKMIKECPDQDVEILAKALINSFTSKQMFTTRPELRIFLADNTNLSLNQINTYCDNVLGYCV